MSLPRRAMTVTRPSPPPAGHAGGRNAGWRHLDARRPRRCRFRRCPSSAAWDLAFHAVAWAHLDLRQVPAHRHAARMVPHPNGALPALRVDRRGGPSAGMRSARRVCSSSTARLTRVPRARLRQAAACTWWLNHQDPNGNDFGGGFLGLDNISPIDRSSLPEGVGWADGTAWMAVSCLACSRSPASSPRPADLRRHGCQVRRAVPDDRGRHRGRRPARSSPGPGAAASAIGPGGTTQLRVQTLASGLSRVCPPPILHVADVRPPCTSLRPLSRRVLTRPERDPGTSATTRPGTGSCCPVDYDELRLALASLFDEDAFPHGLHWLSKRHVVHARCQGYQEARIEYEPAEGRTKSLQGVNWRGPGALDAAQRPDMPRWSAITNSLVTGSTSVSCRSACSTRSPTSRRSLADRLRVRSGCPIPSVGAQ